MCAYPPYKDGVVEELYDNNQSVMASVYVENIMLIPSDKKWTTKDASLSSTRRFILEKT